SDALGQEGLARPDIVQDPFTPIGNGGSIRRGAIGAMALDDLARPAHRQPVLAGKHEQFIGLGIAPGGAVVHDRHYARPANRLQYATERRAKGDVLPPIMAPAPSPPPARQTNSQS